MFHLSKSKNMGLITISQLLINGVKNNVSIYLDSKLKSYKNIFAHPLENNQTLEITFDQLEKFFRKLSIEPKYINLDS